MPDLYELLAGSLGGEEDYLADNPFYTSGVGIAKMGMPQPRNNTEAILGPALQGLLAGTLLGYGKEGARQAGYQDYKASPFLQSPYNASQIGPVASGNSFANMLANSSYSADNAPPGWTAKQGKRDLLLSALNFKKAQDEEAEKAKIRADLAKTLAGKGIGITESGELAPLPGFAEASGKIAEAEEKGKASGKGKLEGLPAEVKADVLSSQPIIRQTLDVAKSIEKSGIDFAKLRLLSNFSAFDDKGIGQRLSNLADLILRSRTGATAPDTEKDELTKLYRGDWTADPSVVVKYLRRYAKDEAARSKGMINLASGDPLEAFNSLETEAESGLNMPPPKPGYKRQQNTKTGEWRYVPK